MASHHYHHPHKSAGWPAQSNLQPHLALEAGFTASAGLLPGGPEGSLRSLGLSLGAWGGALVGGGWCTSSSRRVLCWAELRREGRTRFFTGSASMRDWAQVLPGRMWECKMTGTLGQGPWTTGT